MARSSVGRRPGIAGTSGLVGVALACGLMPAPAPAWIADWGAGYSAVYSDNIRRTPNNERAEWIHIGRGSFMIEEATDSMSTRVASQVEYRHYGRNTFDDEALIGIDGEATWAISPRQLSFTIEDRFTQVPVVPTLTTTPANRQDTNVFSLGPDATLRLTSVTRGQLGGRYTNIFYQTAPNDSDRITAYARLMYDISPITSLSASYEPSWIDYRNDAINPDYDRQDMFVTGRTRRPTTDLSVDIGRTFIERKNTALPDVDGRLLRASVTRRLNSLSTVNLTAVDEYSDSGRDQFVVNPLVEITPSPAAINTTDFVGGGLFAAQRVDAAYVQQRVYGLTRINLFWRELDFESPQLMLDQRVSGAFADIGFDFSASFTGGVFGNYSDTEYLNVVRDDTDYGVGARWVYRFQRYLSVAIEGRWSGRDSTLPSVEYDERRVIVSLAYDSNFARNRTNPFLELNNPLYR